MKRKLLFIVLLLSSFSLIQGQTEKGKFQIGTSSNFNFTSTTTKWKTDYGNGDSDKILDLNINAQAGYFIFNNCVAGFLIPYSHTKENDNYRESSISLIPFLLVYFGTSKTRPFVYGGIGPGKSTSKQFSQGNEIKTPFKLLSYEAGAGFAVFIKENISLDFGLGYASVRSRWVDRSSNMNWESTTGGIGATIGFSIYL